MKNTLENIVITELPEADGTKWFLNINKFNDETDVEISADLANYILLCKKLASLAKK